jgi:hypothetical protein
MPIPWEARVQKSGQLTVFPAEKMLSASAWGPSLFQRILFEFNRLGQVNLLGVRMVSGTQEPQRNGLGADIRFDVTNGPCKFFNISGRDEEATLDTSPGHIKGVCFKVVSGVKFQKTWKAFVFLPVNPIASDRTVGVNVRIALALHELLHACGLNEDDPGHGTPAIPAQGDLDLYATGGVVLPATKPDDDQFLIGGKLVPGRGGQFTITPRTATLVQSIWLLGQF